MGKARLRPSRSIEADTPIPECRRKRRPDPFNVGLPNPDPLFRGQIKLSVANVERFVPCVEVADDQRPDRAGRMDVDREQLLEQGLATQVDNLWWEYTTTSTASGSLTVLAAAQDMPGNVTEMSKTGGI